MDEPIPTFPVADRYSYLWLVLGSGLGLFSFADWSVPLAPWLSILCLIRFSHSQPPLRGYLLLCLLGTATPIVHFVWLGIAPAGFPPHMLYGMVIVGTLLMNLAYLADRLITPRIPGLLATLVFPVTLTCWEFVFSTGNPAGNFGAIGYSQHGNLPVMQLVSITGLAGLTFLISWFGSSVNWMWERSFAWPRARPCLVMYGSALAIVLLYGGARLAFHAAPAGTMRVASFTEMDLRTEGAALWPLIRKDRAAFRRLAGEFHDRYFEKTRLQADAGADLILWPELAIICAAEDEAAILERGKRLAREKRIFLAMPLFVSHLNERSANKLIVVDPRGEIVMEHYKYGGNQFEGTVLGDGVLRTFVTPTATLSGLICWDLDFPATVRQAGQNGTDILLAPTADWRDVAGTHADMAVFRAIENGVSLVRQADNGLSYATDPYGRVLASMDHFTASERLMVAQVPVNGVQTIYSIVGDLFAWLTVIAFPLFAGWALVLRRREKRAATAASLPPSPAG